MSDVNTNCVSLANGALSPDLRVNYEFGLVLGVKEFRQEQLYFLEKDYQHNRALHGYGTVYGLRVTTSRPPEDLEEVLITVEPGMAIDQWGRALLVRTPQCAKLGAWLAKQKPEDIAKNKGASDDLHIYVVARYDECMDALVPIPGQPCSSSDTLQAPSRIRDSFNIELRWQPPAMDAWDAVQRFAQLMAHVRIEANLPFALSDEDKITALVRTLDQPGVFQLPDDGASSGSPPEPVQHYLRLPSETAHEALDRIFTVWVTEVRPRIKPDLSDPAASSGNKTSEAAVLLARIDFVPADPFLTSNPQIAFVGDPVNDGRPFLLHTQLIQELIEPSVEVEAGGKLEREFATLAVRSSRVVHAWVHHPQVLDLPANPAQGFTLTSEGRSLAIAQVNRWSGLDNVFEFVVSAPDLIAPGEHVALTFHLDALSVLNNGPLTTSIDALDFDYVGHTGNDLTAYTIAGLIQPTREFVSFDTLPGNADIAPSLQLWFHTDQPVHLPDTLQVKRNDTPTTFTASASDSFAFVWQVRPADGSQLANDDQLTFAFDTGEIRVGAPNVALTDVIGEQRLAFLGYDGNHTLQTFYTVDLPQQVQPGPTLDEILQAVLKLPDLPFATITLTARVLPATGQQGLLFEIWFHMDVKPEGDQVRIFENPKFTVFAEVENAPTPVPFTMADQGFTQHNVFRTFLDVDQWKGRSAESPYLRFVFPIDANHVIVPPGQQMTLRDYINKFSIKFQGNNGLDTIVVYVRVPTAGGGLG